jgi:hypothetical protein
MNRRRNSLLYAGFLLSIAAFASYFYFVRFPSTRDFPWVNLLLFAAALALLGLGLARAYGKPQDYRGKIAGPILTFLSVGVLGFFLFINFSMTRHLPVSAGAPRVGQKVPDFTLPDANGAAVTLASLRGDGANGGGDHWVLLIFYRGYW